jgi:hypothetical protein
VAVPASSMSTWVIASLWYTTSWKALGSPSRNTFSCPAALPTSPKLKDTTQWLCLAVPLTPSVPFVEACPGRDIY